MFDVFIFYIIRFFLSVYKRICFFKIFGGHPQWNSDINKAIKKNGDRKWSQSRKLKENISNGKIITGQKKSQWKFIEEKQVQRQWLTNKLGYIDTQFLTHKLTRIHRYSNFLF